MTLLKYNVFVIISYLLKEDNKMNKKKLATGLAALALIGVVGVGGSLAWFTDTKDATNTFTTNHVQISLSEENWGGNSQVFNPGATFKKDPVVTVAAGSSDAYVRIREVKLVITPENGRNPSKTEYTLEELNVTIDNAWKKGSDGNYYYQTKLSAGQKTSPLFSLITLPGKEWTNDYANATVNIEITAEAIQADNFTPVYAEDKTTIINWGDTGTIEPYVVTNDED